MNHHWIKALFVPLLAAALVGCPTDTPPAETLYTKGNAWSGEVPSSAEQVSSTEFKNRVASGELRLLSDTSVAAQQQAREKQYQDDKAFLQSVPDKDPNITALLAEAASSPNYDADRAVVGQDGQRVMVFGLGTQLRNAADAYKRSQSVDNALAGYSQIYDLLPADLKSQSVTPDSLKAASLAAIQAALSQVNSLLGANPSTLKTARLEVGNAAGSGLRPQALNAGNGTDNNGACSPSSFAQRYWFPLKNFISPMKSQGGRNTCWAFTAIGAVESRERVQNNNPVNLSEQFLVNKVKQDWSPSDYNEGGSADYALNTALGKNQILPVEPFWTYNPALGRSSGKDGEEGSYFFTCIQGIPRAGGGFDPYNGTCSDTAHQSKQVCTLVNGAKYCSSTKVEFAGAGIASSKTAQIWNNGSPFFLNSYRQLLSQGNVLMASFPVYKGFMDDVKGAGEADLTKRGVVSNYSRTKLEGGKEVAGAYGNHVVQIVGFLSNDDLTSVGITPNIGGGGYFIIKNSWGCNAGDAGYYYVPADYVSSIFSDISVLNFDNRRSDAWHRELVTPGGADAPTINVKALNVRVDLRVEADLAKFFKVSHPVAKSVNLSVDSDKDGSLYNGAWNTDPNTLFGPSLKFTFATPGTRTLTLVAKYGSTQARNIINVDVVNTPPTLELQTSGAARQGEDYFVTATIKDINEADLRPLCDNAVWSVDAPDALSSNNGCVVKVKFGAQGVRTVKVSVTDSNGSTGSSQVTLSVLPPPENPFPRIASSGVYSRESRGGGSILRTCSDFIVSGGSTIDLRQDGCTFGIVVTPPPRYSASVSVENPTAEALTYDWKLLVKDFYGVESELLAANASSKPSFGMRYVLTVNGAPINGLLVTQDCKVTLKVNAPDPTRSKGPITVWSGKCSYEVTPR